MASSGFVEKASVNTRLAELCQTSLDSPLIPEPFSGLKSWDIPIIVSRNILDSQINLFPAVFNFFCLFACLFGPK